MHIYSKMKLPRLGAVLLGTIARDLGWEVRVYVEDVAPIDYRDVLTADLVGISTITSTARRAYVMADAIREHGLPVVMGGPHVTFLADEALTHSDYVVRGEGEGPLPMLMDALRSGGDLSAIPNLSYRNANGEVCHNDLTYRADDLDALPYPDFDLVVGWDRARGFGPVRVMPVMTSRGCPYGCKFCSVIGMFGRKMRYRSVENVVGELRQRLDVGTHIFFYDDNFTASKKRAKKLITEMGGLFTGGSHWSTQVRTDVGKDPELMDMMAASHCTHVYIGFESVSPEALAAMDKKQDIDDVYRAVRELHARKIDIHGMFVFGFDTDTAPALRATTRFAVKSGIMSAQFLILTPLPGTPLYDELAADGRLILSDWSHFDGHHVAHRPARLAPWELQWAQMKAHAVFYSRRRTVSRLMAGYLERSLIYLYARRLNAKWRRANRVYLSAMRLAERARDLKFRFDFEIDLSEIRRQIERAAQSIAPTASPA